MTPREIISEIHPHGPNNSSDSERTGWERAGSSSHSDGLQKHRGGCSVASSSLSSSCTVYTIHEKDKIRHTVVWGLWLLSGSSKSPLDSTAINTTPVNRLRWTRKGSGSPQTLPTLARGFLPTTESTRLPVRTHSHLCIF